MKQSNYITVLKESLQEADTTKTSDILGPMVEPILGYDGKGELKTHKSAADILKKYYFEGEGNEGESVIEVTDPDTVTKGEPDQKKIDGVKKRVEEVIKSTTQTDQPTEKTLKEMVVDLEDILFEDSNEIDNDMASNLEALLESDDLDNDDIMISNLESLLESDIEDYSDDNESLLESDKSKEDKDCEDVEAASEDVIIDKNTKTKLESMIVENKNEDDEEDEDEAVEKNEDVETDDEDSNPLDVDKELKEEIGFSDKLSAILSEDSGIDDDNILENIEDILENVTTVSGDITGIDSLHTNEEDDDIDDNPLSTKVTTEGIEDSVLEWLIMEIEDGDMVDDNEIFLEDETSDDEIDNDFIVSKIDSENIRV